MRATILLIFLTVSVPFVAASNDYPKLQRELDANRKKWRSQGIVGYDMTITRQCFCVQEFRGPFEVSVQRGSIVKVAPKNQFSDDLPTVEGVFDFIEKAILDKAAKIDVSYNSKLGYPETSFVDFDFQIADEERGFDLKVTSVRRAPVPSVKPPGGVPSGNGFNRRLHFRNLLKWRNARPSSYKYELTRSCFCAPDFVGPFIVTVHKGRVVKVVFKDASKGPVPPDTARKIPTITGLFTLITREALKADKVDIKYDPRLGYPTSAFIDRIKNAIDDELTYIAKLL